MRSHLLTSISAIALAAGAGQALAGSPMEQPSWEGPYLGLFGGFANLSATEKGNDGGSWTFGSSPAPQTTNDAFGAIIGGTAGMNWQNGMFLLGVEGDIAWSNFGFSKHIADQVLDQTARLRGLATARLRAGIVDGNNLFFITGGVAAANLLNSGDDSDDIGDSLVTKTGWRFGPTVGVGAETKLTPNMSFKADILASFFDAGQGGTSSYAFDFHNTTVVGRVGLNFGF
jgi:outer membrane immunogenic protein